MRKLVGLRNSGPRLAPPRAALFKACVGVTQKAIWSNPAKDGFMQRVWVCCLSSRHSLEAVISVML